MFVSRIVFRVTHSRTGFGFRKSQPSRTQRQDGAPVFADREFDDTSRIRIKPFSMSFALSCVKQTLQPTLTSTR